VKVVSELLGHATPGFTLNVYQAVLPGMQAEAAKTFDQMLGGANEEPSRPVPAGPLENPLEDRASGDAKEAASEHRDRL